MKTIKLPDHEVLNYIPQRSPVILIDELLSSDQTSTFTRFTVKEGQLFVHNGYMQEAGLMENIAQTAAAGVGYTFAVQEAPVPPGFIGALKNFKVARLPKVGEVLTTKTSVLQEVFEITLIAGEVRIGEELVASTEMKIVLKK